MRLALPLRMKLRVLMDTVSHTDRTYHIIDYIVYHSIYDIACIY